MNYSKSMLLSREVQNWTHLFRMCSHGANTYKCHMPDSFKVISLVTLSTPCFKTREEILVGTAEDVPMLASKRTILQMDMSLKALWDYYYGMLSSSSEIQGH